MLGTWKDYDIYFNEDRGEIAFYKRGEYKFGVSPLEFEHLREACLGFIRKHYQIEDSEVAKKSQELGIK